MKITVNTQAFTQALRTVERVSGKSVSLPILGAVLLKTQKGMLEISTTNLEAGIIYTMSVRIEKEGIVAIPARTLLDSIQHIKSETITLTVKDQTLHIESKEQNSTILGYNADEFPIIPKVEKVRPLQRKSQEIKTALANVVPAAATSDIRPELHGVYFEVSSKETICAATDSFRLAEHRIPGGGDSISCIIPRNTVIELIRLLEFTGDDVAFYFSDSQLGLVAESFTFVSRLVDGKYPDYKKVLPEETQSTITLEKADLERTTQVASVFSSSIADIALSAKKDTLTIAAKNSDRGALTAHIPVVLDGEPFSISVNYHYVLDGIKPIAASRVVLGFTGEGSPLMVKSVDGDGYTYVIMPLRQ